MSKNISNLSGRIGLKDNLFKKMSENVLNDSPKDIKEIAKEYNLNIISKKKYKNNNNENEILKEIYSKRGGEKVQLIDKNDYFILFEINKINKILPNNNDQAFIDNIKKQIILKKKFDLHQQLFEKIQEKKINDKQFVNIAKNQVNILSIKINGIYDNSKFDSDSVKLLYSLPKNSFTLITDDKNNIYLAKINNIISENLLKDDPKIKDYQAKTNNKIINDIYNSYDLSLNSKYKVKIFENTLDRVKNYFK